MTVVVAQFAMTLLERASAKSKERNFKQCQLDFNASFGVAGEDEFYFMSKLLELTYENIEILYLCLCTPEKRRLSAKQYDKRNSLKKKSSVFDMTNAAFEKDGHFSSNSLGRHRNTRYTGENEQQRSKECLRRVFCIKRDFKKSVNEESRLKECINIHTKASNYFALVQMLTDYKDKPFFSSLLQTLTKQDKAKLCETSIYNATNCPRDLKKDSIIPYSIKHCHLAISLNPQGIEQHVLLCKRYRENNQNLEASMTAKTFLNTHNILQPSILMQQFLCRIDEHEYRCALAELEMVPHLETYKDLLAVRALVLLLCQETKMGMLELTNCFDEPKTLVEICEQLKKEDFVIVLEAMKIHKEENPDFELFRDFCEVLLPCLTKFKHEDLYYEKLYCDCLYVCEEYEACERTLIELIQQYKDSTLPMVYLAMFRLNRGAYVAASQDFRMLFRLKGSRRLSEDLLTLHDSDRQEIARVHRAHAFRFLKHDLSYREASECFSVAICAIGYAATGLLLSRGLCYMQLNDFEAAIEDFSRCLFINPNIASAMCARAVAYAVTTHVEEAIRDFRVAYSLEMTSCHKCLIKLPLEHVLNFSQMLIQYVKQEAERVFLSKHNNNNNNSDSDDNKKVDDGFDPETLKFSDFLCQVFPRNVDCLSTRIECLYVTGETGAALYETNCALVLFPGEQVFHALKAVLLTKQRFNDESIDELLLAAPLKDNPKIFAYLDRPTRERLAELTLHKAGKLTEDSTALHLYNIAVFLDSTNVECYRARMQCEERCGLTDKWLNDIDRVILYEPACLLYCQRAAHYHTKGDSKQACRDYMNALELNEAQAINYVMRCQDIEHIIGMLYDYATDQFDDPKHVIKICNTALKLDPANKALRALRDRAKSPSHKCLIQ